MQIRRKLDTFFENTAITIHNFKMSKVVILIYQFLLLFRAVQRSSRPLQGRRLLDAEVDGRIRGLSALGGLRLASDRTLRRPGQIHGIVQDWAFQA